MKMKLIYISLIIAGLLIGSCLGFLYISEETPESNQEKLYHGPVKPEHDEEYFRRTGVTKLRSSN